MELKDGVPLHKQISDWLKVEIDRGKLKENEKLPSEHELSDKFDVSRVTVRRALQTLENEQLIYRCQGLGSFVSDRRTHKSFTMLNDFSEELAGTGITPSAKVVSFEQADLSDHRNILSYLDIKKKPVAMRLERVRLGDGDPIAFDTTWMPVFYGQLMEGYNLEQKTIFEILEEEYDIPVAKGCFRIEAAVADERLASLLDVQAGTPLLQINRITYTIADKPIYFQQRYYRNDKMVFELMAGRTREEDNQTRLSPFGEFMPLVQPGGSN